LNAWKGIPSKLINCNRTLALLSAVAILSLSMNPQAKIWAVYLVSHSADDKNEAN
jgi:hypothetical protein